MIDPRIEATVQVLAERWRKADLEVLRHLFPLLDRGRPVALEALATVADLPLERVASAVASPLVDRTPEGLLSGLIGVSTLGGAFQQGCERNGPFACCALVACMLPLLLERDVRVETKDPVSGESVELTLSRRGAMQNRPASAQATCVTLRQDPGQRAAESFCRHLRLFATSASAERFAADDPERFVVPPEQLGFAARELFLRTF